MDYFQITDRYRKREFRTMAKTLLRLSIIVFAIWIGWFWGYSQRSALTSTTSERLVRMEQDNERLEQRLTKISTELDQEKQHRLEAELVIKQDSDDSSQTKLMRQIARYLSQGVSEDEIRLALQALSSPSRCRPIEEHNIAVATGFFAGKEATADLFGGGVRIFVEGETGRGATRDKPWFDPKSPVSLRIAYLNGEKISTGVLPVETAIIADNWLIRINAEAASLQGYVLLSVYKCSLG